MKFEIYPLGSLCSRVTSGGTPKSTNSKYYDGSIPWLNTKEINFNRIYATERNISKLGLENSSAKWIVAPAVIVAMYGATAGKTAVALIPLTTNQACCNMEIREDKADFRFVYYYLKWKYKELSSLANGGAQQNLNAQLIRDFPVMLPNLLVQHQISDILWNIDDKIELNQRINDNLQQQAFALFDRLLSRQHSAKCKLSQIAFINARRVLKKNEFARCIDMTQLSTSGSFPNGWEVKPYNGGMKFTNGDTLLARITPCLENGKTAYIDFLNEKEVAFGSTEYIIISSQGKFNPVFFYCLARYPAFVDYAIKNMNGSSGRQRVSAEVIGNFMLPMLTWEEIAAFNQTVPHLFRRIKNNSIENMKLAQLRDILLPKLMFGEVGISSMQL